MKIFLVLLFACSSAMAKDYFVKIGTTNLYQEPNKSSAILEILKKGTKLIFKNEKKAKFVKVSIKGKTGWVSKYHITTKNVKVREQSLFVEVKDFSKDSRESSSAYTATASARGFTSGGGPKIRREIIVFNKAEEKYRKSYEALEFLILGQEL